MCNWIIVLGTIVNSVIILATVFVMVLTTWGIWNIYRMDRKWELASGIGIRRASKVKEVKKRPWRWPWQRRSPVPDGVRFLKKKASDGPLTYYEIQFYTRPDVWGSSHYLGLDEAGASVEAVYLVYRYKGVIISPKDIRWEVDNTTFSRYSK